MDGPNINWAFFEELRNFRGENNMNKLLPTGSCGLHSIHLAFKTGENSTDWGVKKILKAIYQIHHDSPVRRADFSEVTGSEQFPLPFCGTRWIKDQKVALRAIEIWDNVCQICRFWKSFLTIYQYAKPMTPFIHDDLYQLLKDLTSKFMKKEVLD